MTEVVRRSSRIMEKTVSDKEAKKSNTITGKKDDVVRGNSFVTRKRSIAQRDSVGRKNLPVIVGGENSKSLRERARTVVSAKNTIGRQLKSMIATELKSSTRKNRIFNKVRSSSSKSSPGINKGELSESTNLDAFNKSNIKHRHRRLSINSSTFGTTSGSEDEWEDMEELDDEKLHSPGDPKERTVEVTINGPVVVEESEESKWAKFLRLEVNRKLRERQINCHKVHLLCFIAHLRIWVRSLVYNEALPSLCLSLIPEGYIARAELNFDVATAERFLKWFKSAFQQASTSYPAKDAFCVSEINRLELLVGDRVYETTKDLASLLFLFMIALKQLTRLCISCQPIPLKLSKDSIFINGQVSFNPWEKVTAVACDKSNTATMSQTSSTKSTHDGHSDRGKTSLSNSRIEKSRTKKKRTAKDELPASSVRCIIERNYWVEYWDENTERWISMDPLKGLVDMPEMIEADVTPPMHYVFCIDNKFGMRDVTARYSSKFLTIDVRRLRTDQEWLNETLKTYRSRNRKRERLEDVELHDVLLTRPKPLTVAEYKGHPLYVLKKDILKYEAVYPEDQKPIGQVRGHDIYPRSSVFHLEGSLNWMKEARSVKPGEKPYKIVKGRPITRVPPEIREPRTLDLYGYWQTEPYVPPKVVDGRIPRNEFGNIYMYKSCMIPDGCVHLKLDGLLFVARQFNIECVPAVVGWEFHKGGNHPILEGCVVLKKDEKELRKAWKKWYEKRKIAAKKKQEERVLKNWRRLIKGVLTMKKVRAKFLFNDPKDMQIDEKLEKAVKQNTADGDNEVERCGKLVNDDIAQAWPKINFPLPERNNE